MLERSLARKSEFTASLLKQNDADVSGWYYPGLLCLQRILTT